MSMCQSGLGFRGALHEHVPIADLVHALPEPEEVPEPLPQGLRQILLAHELVQRLHQAVELGVVHLDRLQNARDGADEIGVHIPAHKRGHEHVQPLSVGYRRDVAVPERGESRDGPIERRNVPAECAALRFHEAVLGKPVGGLERILVDDHCRQPFSIETREGGWAAALNDQRHEETACHPVRHEHHQQRELGKSELRVVDLEVALPSLEEAGCSQHAKQLGEPHQPDHPQDSKVLCALALRRHRDHVKGKCRHNID
mmetsp:Transcript_29307/g.93776  ORF Transcript_29307/g.93776 Transcript_29307/m.93776 type:complete len:257 (+) Transcript_29307:49-819(+)